jgi:hypothetical protein
MQAIRIMADFIGNITRRAAYIGEMANDKIFRNT